MKQECDERIEKKGKRELPRKHAKESDYTEKVDKILPRSANITRKVKKIKSPQKEFKQKGNLSGRSISDFETYNSYCYRLQLADRHPKSKTVYDDQNERTSMIAEWIDSLETYDAQYKRAANQITKDELLNSKIVDVLVAAYCEEEDDLHSGNIGKRADGLAVTYDADRTTWPLTATYAGYDPPQERSEQGRPARDAHHAALPPALASLASRSSQRRSSPAMSRPAPAGLPAKRHGRSARAKNDAIDPSTACG